MSAAPSRLPASLRSQVEQQASAAGITSASFNVWLDGQQQLRKLILRGEREFRRRGYRQEGGPQSGIQDFCRRARQQS
jgi:hypothetical protein